MIVLKINGKEHRVDVAPGEMLLETLRKIGYKSVKQGCDTTNCGLCTVWLDEKPILSCSMLTQRVHNRAVTTLEGLREEALVFTSLLAEQGGEQCGFCSPGLVMNVLAMKRELENPDEEQIVRFLQGNLCRCTGYASQMRAIKQYLEVE